VKAPDDTVAGIHKNILIEGNIIEGENADCGISVSGAQKVVIRNNAFIGCKQPIVSKFSKELHFQNNYNGKMLLKNILQ
jgi:hypothetical protein